MHYELRPSPEEGEGLTPHTQSLGGAIKEPERRVRVYFEKTPSTQSKEDCDPSWACTHDHPSCRCCPRLLTWAVWLKTTCPLHRWDHPLFFFSQYVVLECPPCLFTWRQLWTPPTHHELCSPHPPSQGPSGWLPPRGLPTSPPAWFPSLMKEIVYHTGFKPLNQFRAQFSFLITRK